MIFSPATQDLQHKLQAFVEEIEGVTWRPDVLMSGLTTYGIGGPADVLVAPQTEEEVLRVMRTTEKVGVPLFVLGGGSNLLVGDLGIRGVVMTLAGALSDIVVSHDGGLIEVGAGAKFPKLTRTALDLGWHPAIGWFGTPGQVGGALKMNAGTREGELGDVVIQVCAVTPEGVRTFAHAECGFSYRNSAFPINAILTRAILQCDDRKSVELMELDRVAKDLLAKRHRTQPKQRSAGSLFKNPVGDYAGRLIEACGLKGRRQGNAQISEVHANFFVNLGGATAQDIVMLASHAADEVRTRFGVELEWEVKRVGEFQ